MAPSVSSVRTEPPGLYASNVPGSGYRRPRSRRPVRGLKPRRCGARLPANAMCRYPGDHKPYIGESAAATGFKLALTRAHTGRTLPPPGAVQAHQAGSSGPGGRRNSACASRPLAPLTRRGASVRGSASPLLCRRASSHYRFPAFSFAGETSGNLPALDGAVCFWPGVAAAGTRQAGPVLNDETGVRLARRALIVRRRHRPSKSNFGAGSSPPTRAQLRTPTRRGTPSHRLHSTVSPQSSSRLRY